METELKEQIFIIKQYTTNSKKYPTLRFEMPESSSLEDVIEAFHAFLIGVTFEFPEGARLGLVYDEVTEKKNVEEKYTIMPGDVSMAGDSASITSTWPDSWSISHPIATTSIGSIIPTTSFSTTTTIDSGKTKPKKKKNNGKRKNKGSSKR